MSNNKDFKVKNGIKPTVYQEKLGTVTNTTTATGFQPVNTWSYDNVSFTFNSQDATGGGMDFNNNGTKMYTIGNTGDRVYQYSLSTAYDISTASYDNVSFSVSGQEGAAFSVHFKPDGTKMYVLGNDYDAAFQYSLSTAFDISTASYDNVSYSFQSQDSLTLNMCFNNNGTKLYGVGDASNRVYQHSLSTAYDLSSGSYDNVNLYVGSQDGNPRDVAFNTNGTKMYLLGDQLNRIHQYSLTTAFDISTASYDGLQLLVNSQASVPMSIIFKPDGTKMYIVDYNLDKIHAYSSGASISSKTLDLSTGSVFDVTLTSDTQLTFSNPADSGTVSQATVLLKSSGNHSISYDSSIEFTGESAPEAPATSEADVLTFSTRDGGTSYQASHIIDGAA